MLLLALPFPGSKGLKDFDNYDSFSSTVDWTAIVAESAAAGKTQEQSLSMFLVSKNNFLSLFLI